MCNEIAPSLEPKSLFLFPQAPRRPFFIFSRCLREMKKTMFTPSASPFAADIISAIEFDKSGEQLATGDRGGRVVLFQRVANEGNADQARGVLSKL